MTRACRRSWRLAIAIALLGVSALSLAARGYPSASVEMLGFILLVILVIAVEGRLSRRTVFWAAACVLGVIAASSLFVSYRSAVGWHAPGERMALHPRPDQQRISGRPGGAVTAFRRWRTLDAVDHVVAEGVIRLEGGAPGRDWFVGPAGALSASPAEAFTVLDFSGPGQYAYRSAFLAAPIAGRSFFAAVEIMAHGAERACGYVALGEHGTGPKTLEHVCVDDEWSSVPVRWSAGRESNETRVDVVLSSFDAPLRVRSAALHLGDDAQGVPLAPLAPTNATVRVSWDLPWATREDASREARVVVPLVLGQGVPFAVEAAGDIPARVDLWTSVHLEGGLVATVDGLRLRPRPSVVPAPFPARQDLWFGHPNRLGHATAAVFAAAFVTAPTSVAALVVGAAAVPSLAVSGSRTAFAAAFSVVVLTMALQWARGRSSRPGMDGATSGAPQQPHRGGPRRRERAKAVTSTALSVTAALAVGWALLSVMGGRPAFVDEPSLGNRVAIWGLAVELIPAAPLAVPERDFEASWRSRYGDQPNATHAHNGLLDAILRFGVGGSAALAAAFAVAFWQGRSPPRAAANALLATVVLVVLNATDVAYLDWWVLVPLFALAKSNTWRQGGRTPEPGDGAAACSRRAS